MARHKKSTDEKYNQPFATRFRLLMNTGKRTSQAEIADAVGKSRQVISQYYNGESEPPYDTLVKIAQYFHVTVDYMIGATEVSSTSLDVKEIVRQTGISEKNVTRLIHQNKLVRRMEKLYLDTRKNPDEKYINPRDELLNALIEYALSEEAQSDFRETISTLESPSSEGFVKAIENDDTFCEVSHPQAISIGVEAFFNQKNTANEVDWVMSQRGMWNLTPEEAFEYYCLRLGDGLKTFLIKKLVKLSEWRNIEPYREELQKYIEKANVELMKLGEEYEWQASKKETEATE